MRTKKLSKSFLFFVFFLLISVLQIDCGSTTNDGTTTPGGGNPIDILAPVSHLSVSDLGDGNLRITAGAGFSDPNTEVTITISDPDSASNLRISFQMAYAQTSSTVTSNSSGAFSVEMAGEAGDTVTLEYTSDGEETTSSTTVPSNIFALTDGFTFADLDVGTSSLFLAGNDGEDGQIAQFDLDDNAIGDTFDFAGAGGTSRVTVDLAGPNVFAYDPPSDLLLQADLSDDSTNSFDISVPSTDISSIPGENDVLWIAHNDSVGGSLFDVGLEGPTSTVNPTTDTSSLMQTAFFIDVNLSADTGTVLGLLGEMEDNTVNVFQFSVDEFGTALPGNDVEVNTDDPGGFVLFNNGTEALVSDRSNDRVFRVDLTGEDVEEIDVGDDPRGIALNTAETMAFVVNSQDRTITVIDLDDNSTSTSDVILGLMPSEIVFFNFGEDSDLAILNLGDNSLSLINSDDL